MRSSLVLLACFLLAGCVVPDSHLGLVIEDASYRIDGDIIHVLFTVRNTSQYALGKTPIFVSLPVKLEQYAPDPAHGKPGDVR